MDSRTKSCVPSALKREPPIISVGTDVAGLTYYKVKLNGKCGENRSREDYMARARITRLTKLDVQAELSQPRLIALVFADYAAETKEGKMVLSGVFDTLHLPPEDPRLASFFLYIRL